MYYNKLKVVTLLAINFLTAIQLQAQSKVDTLDRHWPKYISLDRYLQPFTKADTVIDEIILPLRVDNNKNPFAQLLFPAKKIISVKNVYLRKEYFEGKDWKIKGRKLEVMRNSEIPFLKDEELVFQGERRGFSLPSKTKGHSVLFGEGKFFLSYQLAVTYIPEHLAMSFPEPLKTAGGSQLDKTKQMLKTGKPLKIVFYGNSIEIGRAHV